MMMTICDVLMCISHHHFKNWPFLIIILCSVERQHQRRRHWHFSHVHFCCCSRHNWNDHDGDYIGDYVEDDDDDDDGGEHCGLMHSCIRAESWQAYSYSCNAMLTCFDISPTCTFAASKQALRSMHWAQHWVGWRCFGAHVYFCRIGIPLWSKLQSDNTAGANSSIDISPVGPGGFLRQGSHCVLLFHTVLHLVGKSSPSLYTHIFNIC